MAAPSFQDYFDTGKAEAIDRRPDLTFSEGDISEMLIAGASAMADLLTGYAAQRFKATYLDGAEEDDLTTLADDHWNVQVKPATPATGQVTFTRGGSTFAAGTIAAGTVVATEKNAQGEEIQVSTDVDVSWATGDSTVRTVNATALNTGTAGNVAAGTLVRIVSTIFDPSISASNVYRFAGGDDQESAEDLRERVRQVPATLRRGTLAAIEHGAMEVPEVKRAKAEDDVDSFDVLTGIVNLYVTDASGYSSPSMILDVQNAVKDWRAGGIIVNVYGGTLLPVDIRVKLTMRAGVDTVALASDVHDAIIARVAKLKINETLTTDIITQAVRNVDENILKIDMIEPIGDSEPLAGQIIRAGTVTVT